MDERPISRRGTRAYMPERLPTPARRERERAVEPRAEQLTAAGTVTSALRRELRARAIDPRLARLVLCFGRGYPQRPRDIAWRLGISRSAASRVLDRAEALGLVDKLYLSLDRRGTWARLTEQGRAFRLRVEQALAACEPDQPRFGPGFGIRAYWDRGR